jgi:hypothetical protein
MEKQHVDMALNLVCLVLVGPQERGSELIVGFLVMRVKTFTASGRVPTGWLEIS